jgi:hypothetical protein
VGGGSGSTGTREGADFSSRGGLSLSRDELACFRGDDLGTVLRRAEQLALLMCAWKLYDEQLVLGECMQSRWRWRQRPLAILKEIGRELKRGSQPYILLFIICYFYLPTNLTDKLL